MPKGGDAASPVTVVCDPKLFSFRAGTDKSIIAVFADMSGVCDPPPRLPRLTGVHNIRLRFGQEYPFEITEMKVYMRFSICSLLFGDS